MAGAVVQVKARSEIDDKLLALAGTCTPEEISKRLNGSISPERAASRIKELLRSPNWLSAQEQEARIWLMLEQTLEELRGQFLSIDQAKVQLTYMKELLGRIDIRKKASEGDLNRLYSNQGVLMAQAYDIALAYMKGKLSAHIDAEEWDRASAEAILHARAELAKYEIED